jgi:adenylate cyclase
MALWFKGFPDRAVETLREGLHLAEGEELFYSLSGARAYLGSLHQLRREPEATRRRARETLAAAERHGFAYREAVAMMLDGWVEATSGGEIDRAIERIRAGLELSRRIGVKLDWPYYLALLAEAQLAGGRIHAGLQTLEQGLEFIASTRSYFYEPELHRLKGLMLLADGPQRDVKRAEECYERGLEVARAHGARSLELRTAVSLCRLHRELGRSDRKSVSLVTKLADGFTEGLDTPDLVAAKELVGG